MKRPFSLFIFLGWWLVAGCGSGKATPTPFPATPFPPAQTLPQTRPSTPTLIPLVTPTTAVPLLLPTVTLPPISPGTVSPQPQTDTRFHNLRFAAVSGAASQDTFPLGTSEVFAVWDYAGMNPGDFVQRAWRYNGTDWLSKEESWERGSSGTVSDVSIYDKAIGGLAPGEYQLDLFVNGVWQAGGSFILLPRLAEGDPSFSGLHFTAYPNGPAQTSFPAGIEQVYGIWNYSNMGVSDVVKREWMLNGAVWLEREETWDYFHYGPAGMVTDVSIYDFEGGLPSGSYTMVVYLNGVKQLEGAFTIGE